MAFLNLYQHAKIQLISSNHSWDTAYFRVPWSNNPKNLKASYFEYFEHVWILPSKTVMLTFRRLKQSFMLICMQKINYITHYFVKKLQRNSKLVFLGNMDMSGNTDLKWWHRVTETFHVCRQAKDQVNPSRFSWNSEKIL